MEAKPLPDFSATDNYQVSLKFSTEIRDVSFLVYIRQEQAKRPKLHKLNVFQLMALYEVCFRDGLDVKPVIIKDLLAEGTILKDKNENLLMPKEYQKIYSEINSTSNIDWINALRACAIKYDNIITRKTYMEFLPKRISVDRVRYILTKLETKKVLKREGIGKGTKYAVIKIPEHIEL